MVLGFCNSLGINLLFFKVKLNVIGRFFKIGRKSNGYNFLFVYMVGL